MKRRELIAAAAAGITFGIARTGSGSADDERLIRQLIKDRYSVFYTERDKHKYQSLLTEDYLLLEKGEILDAEHDIAMMPSPGNDYQRTDTFDFRRVRVQEDTAYVIYVVKSEITNKKKCTSKRSVGVSRERDSPSFWQTMEDCSDTLDSNDEAGFVIGRDWPSPRLFTRARLLAEQLQSGPHVNRALAELLTVDLLAVAMTALSAIWILVDMERDHVLSRLRTTTPGRVDINWEFIKRLAVYGVLPLLAVIASLFPEVGGTLFGWLEPLRKLSSF